MLFNFFSLWKVLKTMFVDFKRSTLKIPVSDYLKPMENSVFSFLFLILIQLNLVWLNVFLC